jgi:hypothetical protein
MKSLNGIELEVGQEVWLLQTPVIRDHEYILGKVTKVNAKTVTVNGYFHERFVRGFVNKDVQRYGHQVFVKID